MAKTPARGAVSRRLSTSALALAAAAARRFYVEGLTKVEIAKQLGVSRFKVARLLADAQEAGLVQIHVVVPSSLDGELADALRERFGVRAVYVVQARGGHRRRAAPGRRRVHRGPAGGERHRRRRRRPGLGPDHLPARRRDRGEPRLPVRAAVRGAAAPRRRGERRRAGAPRRPRPPGPRPATFYAPLAVPDAATADGLRSQSGISEALAELDRLTRAVVSVGAWRPGESTALDALGEADRRALSAAGVVAEITGVLLGADGREVDALADRVIGITGAQLRATPDVIAMACGDLRVEATATALRSGIVSTLVTHASLARRC